MSILESRRDAKSAKSIFSLVLVGCGAVTSFSPWLATMDTGNTRKIVVSDVPFSELSFHCKGAVPTQTIFSLSWGDLTAPCHCYSSDSSDFAPQQILHSLPPLPPHRFILVPCWDIWACASFLPNLFEIEGPKLVPMLLLHFAWRGRTIEVSWEIACSKILATSNAKKLRLRNGIRPR